MTRSTNNVWLHRFACLLAIATLGLVALGGVVTTKGVGMAVPDWPRTYGDHMFLFPPSKWMAGIFFEHSHRLWASLVGLFCGIFALWTWWHGTTGRKRWLGVGTMVLVLGLLGVRHQPGLFVAIGLLSVIAVIWAAIRVASGENRMRWLGVIALAAVIIQGVLGGLRVILDEHGWGTEFGVFHAMLAQVFFAFVCSLALMTSKWWSQAGQPVLAATTASRLKIIFITVTVLIFIQIFFGATMRHQHAGLAVPDFPLAHGKLWPATDAASVQFYNAHRMEAAGEQPITAPHIVVHMLHRFTGFILFFAIIGVAVAAWKRTTAGSPLRRISALWVILALVQVTLGILSILFQRKVDVTTAHVALGALTFATGWWLVMVAARLAAPKQPVVLPDPVLAAASKLKPA
jgi:cytochrome c oxidase assembly protein subunit 15